MNKEVTTTKIAIFQKKEIRKTIYKNEWWFSVADVIEVLTDTVDVRDYIKKMRKRDRELNAYWGTNCPPVEMVAKDGKKRKITSANTEGIFRIIQSIPSPKAEPFKRWLARVGYERIQEIEDPELATKRTRALYKAKGYSDAWIEKRMRGIEVRETLTGEWKKRNVKEGQEYAILTAEISKATFGMTPSQYQKFKGLKRENLRDHMNDLELIFTMLGEASTTEIAKNKDTRGFIENKIAAREGGSVAGKARKDLELKSGKKVSTNKNYLLKKKDDKRLK
ncbi:Bro-N domain-containing protein [Patescibacteria group bacterium]|nr:Bro-N domain-containing protein [Patescibacteria group bacterium]MBU2264797.1 Bro-N domain-containing protein [Patescibacteria group bacterium]